MGYIFPQKEAVKVNVTTVHKGKMAKAGSVFYVASLKFGDTTYTRCIPVDRHGIDDARENEVKGLFRDRFYQDIKTQLKIN